MRLAQSSHWKVVHYLLTFYSTQYSVRLAQSSHWNVVHYLLTYYSTQFSVRLAQSSHLKVVHYLLTYYSTLFSVRLAQGFGKMAAKEVACATPSSRKPGRWPLATLSDCMDAKLSRLMRGGPGISSINKACT